MNNEKNSLDQAVKAFSESTVPAGPSDDLIRDTLAQIEKKQSTVPFMERIYKMKSISKFAAAAVIIIAVSAVFLFNSGPNSVALADVYARVQQAQAFMYKISMTMNGSTMEGRPPQNMKTESTVMISTEYGMKMENTTHLLDQNKTRTHQMYIIPNESVMVQIMPDEKKYMRMEFSDDLLERMKQEMNDPREMIKRMLNSEYTDLGLSEINGVRVQCFQSNDPAQAGGFADEITKTLWVDASTWLPVRSEFSMKRGNSRQMQGVIEDFQWNIKVDADEFTPVIPEDYEDMGSMKLPAMNEEVAVVGLQTFAELIGKYPQKINVMDIVNEFVQAIKQGKYSDTETAERFKRQLEVATSNEERQQLAMKKMMPIQATGMFYATLLQDKKDPAYYGDQVTPEDTDAVLMRWKLDNGKYKVIFGDLSTAEMEYEDLIKIEPQPLAESTESQQVQEQSSTP